MHFVATRSSLKYCLSTSTLEESGDAAWCPEPAVPVEPARFQGVDTSFAKGKKMRDVVKIQGHERCRNAASFLEGISCSRSDLTLEIVLKSSAMRSAP
jgi:hypothetical protein